MGTLPTYTKLTYVDDITPPAIDADNLNKNEIQIDALTVQVNKDQSNIDALTTQVNELTDKTLKLQNITIPYASVIANTDSLSSTFPYCYDYADSSITADTVIQDIVAQDSSNQTAYDSYCYGANLTSAGKVRIYFIAQSSTDMAMTLIKQKGVR
jgi:uncharacterized coiled-coil protein SlyX